MTRINPYGVKTEPAEFCKSLENYKQSYKNNFNEEGKETRPVQTRRPGPSGSQGQLSPPVKSTLWEGQSKASSPEKRKQTINLK